MAAHAWKPGHVQLGYSGQLPGSIGERSEASEALLTDCLAEVKRDYPDADFESESVSMAPTVALTELSANASLVVTGSRGLGVVAGLLLGSVSQHLLNHAHCPVGVVR